MNCYSFSPNDQRWANWLIAVWQKTPPYVIRKPRYHVYRCPKCTGFDHDDMFREGFDEDIRIRGHGDLIYTDDGFLCINEKVRRIIEDNRFAGITLKHLANTEWHVANITRRVETVTNVYELDAPNYCAVCGRARGAYGLIFYLSQIEVPKEAGTFFSPMIDRAGRNVDRDIFATEDIVLEFKKHGIKGGTFTRLLTAEEEAKCKTAIANKKLMPQPRGSVIVL